MGPHAMGKHKDGLITSSSGMYVHVCITGIKQAQLPPQMVLEKICCEQVLSSSSRMYSTDDGQHPALESMEARSS